MNREELEIEQRFLERKLQHVNGYISRCLQKQQATASKARITTKAEQEFDILKHSVQTSITRQAQFKKEYSDLEQLLKRLACDTEHPNNLAS